MDFSILIKRAAFLSAAFASGSAHAASAAADTVPWRPATFADALLATVVFGVVGIGLAIAGFKLFDWAVPFNLEKEICENKNIAAAILCAAFVLGICWIVAAAVS